MTTATARIEWDLKASALADDDYSEEEILSILGPRPDESSVFSPTLEVPRSEAPQPEPPKRREIMVPESALDADVEIGPMPEGYRPHWGDSGAHEGTRAASGPIVGAIDTARRAEEREVAGRASRPAPVVRGIVLSWGGKVERLARAMAELRDLKWYELSAERQDGFYSLAEFALKALEKVEESMDVLAKRRRENGEERWMDVPDRQQSG